MKYVVKVNVDGEALYAAVRAMNDGVLAGVGVLGASERYRKAAREALTTSVTPNDGAVEVFIE